MWRHVSWRPLLFQVCRHNGRSKLINCRGLGTCGTCAVEVAEGELQLLREQLSLRALAHEAGLLSRLHHPIRVKFRAWHIAQASHNSLRACFSSSS